MEEAVSVTTTPQGNPRATLRGGLPDRYLTPADIRAYVTDRKNADRDAA
jgi:hypothetical protein